MHRKLWWAQCLNREKFENQDKARSPKNTFPFVYKLKWSCTENNILVSLSLFCLPSGHLLLPLCQHTLLSTCPSTLSDILSLFFQSFTLYFQLRNVDLSFLSISTSSPVDGPRGSVSVATVIGAGAAAEGAAVASRQPFYVRERSGHGESAAGQCVAGLPQCPSTFAVKGSYKTWQCVILPFRSVLLTVKLSMCVCVPRHLKCVSQLAVDVAAQERSTSPIHTPADARSCCALTTLTCSSLRRIHSRWDRTDKQVPHSH